MFRGRSPPSVSIAVIVATGTAWTAWEFVFRHYGEGRTSGPLLLNASPEAAGAAAVVWILTVVVVMLLGLLVARRFRGG